MRETGAFGDGYADALVATIPSIEPSERGVRNCSSLCRLHNHALTGFCGTVFVMFGRLYIVQAQGSSSALPLPCRSVRAIFTRSSNRAGRFTARVIAEPRVETPTTDADVPPKPIPAGGDPWEDEKWTKYK